jgi:hypothetical protein
MIKKIIFKDFELFECLKYNFLIKILSAGFIALKLL